MGQIFVTSDFGRGITILPGGIRSYHPVVSDVTNVGLGEHNLSDITIGTRNVAIGQKSLYNNTSGSQLTGVGHVALLANTTGILNSAFGRESLYANKTGNENTAFGGNTLEYNTSLSRNVAIGQNALRDQAYDGGNNSDNVAVGEGTLFSNNPTDATNGRQNIAIGGSALANNKTGARNIALSASASYLLQTGNDNIAIGISALRKNVAGSQNTAVGNDALSNTLGSGNVALGQEAGINETGDNKLYISPTNDDDVPLIGGDFANKKVAIARNMISTANPNDFKNRTETLQVEGDAFKTVGNGSWHFPSDRRLKKNILSLSNQEMLKKVVQMQGVSYEMRDENQKGMQFGFIAQDLREIFPSKVKENVAGYLSADYGSYDPMIVEAIKALNQKITHLKKDKTELETVLTTLGADFDTLLAKVNQLETVKSSSTKASTITEK